MANETGAITKIQLKTKTSSKDLSEIDLDLGEALVDQAGKKVIIGGNAHTDTTNKADNGGNIILGASKTELSDISNVEDSESNVIGQKVDIKHIDNSERSHYTLKTKGAKLSKEGNTIEIDATYALSITHNDSTNDTTITLTPPQGDAITGTIADPDWDTKVLHRPIVHWVGNNVSPASGVIASINNGTFSYKSGKSASDLHHYDICIHKQQIADDHYEHTIYIFNAEKSSPSWERLDLEYNAKNVIFDSDISITKNFGKYSGSDTQIGIIPSAGKSVFDVIEDAFGGDDKVVWQTEPSASASAEVSKSEAEVGEAITFTYVVTLNTGTYKHGTRTSTDPFYTQSDKTTGIRYSKVSNSYDVVGNLISNGATLSTKSATVIEGLNNHTFASQTIYRSAVSKRPCSLKGSDIYDNLESEYKSQEELDLGSKTSSCTGYRYWYVDTFDSTPTANDICDASSYNSNTNASKDLGAIASGKVIGVACRGGSSISSYNKTPKLYTYDDFNKSWELVSGAFSSGTNIFVRPENMRAANEGQVVYTSSGADADKYKYYTYSVISSAKYKVTIS